MNITSSSYDEILSVLGRNLGMELSYSDDACDLLLDNRWSLSIVRIPEESRIVLSCVVMESLPEELGYSTLTELLGYALNPMFGIGPAVGIDQESDTLIAYVSIHLSKFEAEEFPMVISKFMEFVLGVYDRINDEDAVSDAYESDSQNTIFVG